MLVSNTHNVRPPGGCGGGGTTGPATLAPGEEGPPAGVSGSRPTVYRPACTQSLTVIPPLPLLARGAQSARANSLALPISSSPAANRPTCTQSVIVRFLSPPGRGATSPSNSTSAIATLPEAKTTGRTRACASESWRAVGTSPKVMGTVTALSTGATLNFTTTTSCAPALNVVWVASATATPSLPL